MQHIEYSFRVYELKKGFLRGLMKLVSLLRGCSILRTFYRVKSIRFSSSIETIFKEIYRISAKDLISNTAFSAILLSHQMLVENQKMVAVRFVSRCFYGSCILLVSSESEMNREKEEI